MRPVSLHKERLEEQRQEQRVLAADVAHHGAGVQSVADSASQLIATASNPRLAIKIEGRMHDLTSRLITIIHIYQINTFKFTIFYLFFHILYKIFSSRYEKLGDKVTKRGDALSDIHSQLTSVNASANSLEHWLSEASELAHQPRHAETTAQRKEDKRPEFEDLMRSGRALIGGKDVTDTGSLRDRLKVSSIEQFSIWFLLY